MGSSHTALAQNNASSNPAQASPPVKTLVYQNVSQPPPSPSQNLTISNSQNITLDPVKVEQIAANLSIANKTLAKELVVEKAKQDQAMKESIQNRTHQKIMHEVKKVQREKKSDPELKEKMAEFVKKEHMDKEGCSHTTGNKEEKELKKKISNVVKKTLAIKDTSNPYDRFEKKQSKSSDYSSKDINDVLELQKSLQKTENMFKKAAVHIEKHIPKIAKDHAKAIDEALHENDYFIEHANKKNDISGLADELIKSSCAGDDESVAPYHHEFQRKEQTVIEAPVVETTTYEPPAVVEAAPPAPVQEYEPPKEHTSGLAKLLEESSFDDSRPQKSCDEQSSTSSSQKQKSDSQAEKSQLTRLMSEIADPDIKEPDVKDVQTQADDQETFSDEMPLIKEFQEEQADDPEVTIQKLAHSIKIDSGDVEQQEPKPEQTSDAPEEDGFLELGAQLGSQVSAKASAQAAMRAKIQAFMKAKASSTARAASKAQAKVKSQDANLIEMLQKQIKVMEAKKNPKAMAHDAKKKAVHNIQKALTNKILKRLDDTQPIVNVFSKMQSLSKMMPAVQDFERRLGILHQVEPIIEQAVNTLQKVIDLKGSPMAPPKTKEEPKPQVVEEDEESTPSGGGGLDMSALQALLGQASQQKEAAAPVEEESSGEPDLAALLGSASEAAQAEAPAEEEENTKDAEKDLLQKLLGKM